MEVRTVLKRASEVKVGDAMVMTKASTWRVLGVRPYEGPLDELKGGFIVTSDRGAITLESHLLVEVLA